MSDTEKKEKKKFKITFLHDFKEFISRGNIIDLAIAVIIGAAFSAIVTSLVNDIIMPLITLAMGGNGIAGASIVLNGVPAIVDGAANPEAVLWNYGNFIQAIINFIIIALCIFTALRIMVKAKAAGKNLGAKHKASVMKKLQKGKISEQEAQEELAKLDAKAEEKPAEPKETAEDLLREIRDLLKAKEQE